MKRIKGFFSEILEDFKIKNSILINTILIIFIALLLIKLVDVMFEFSIVRWIKTLPILYPLFSHVLEVVKSGSHLGMFYIFSISGIVFMPIPIEALFFSYLRTNANVQALFIIATLGLFISQILNYTLGRFLDFLIYPLLNEKSIKKFKKRLFKFEWIAIILMHALPLPFQSFNFITGMFEYDFKKFCLFSFIGCILKSTLLIYVFFRFV
ncbi:VTT domain-containing protein [Candidatus Woesearchaeota archaeon]|nr:VTT domain-containing protein [Candidatus Woesearchaeota archaeon]